MPSRPAVAFGPAFVALVLAVLLASPSGHDRAPDAPTARRAAAAQPAPNPAIAYRYDATRGALTDLGSVSLLPAGESPRPGTGAAEIQVHPSGRFLYASNRGPDVIVVLAVEAEAVAG